MMFDSKKASEKTLDSKKAVERAALTHIAITQAVFLLLKAHPEILAEWRKTEQFKEAFPEWVEEG